MFSSYSPHSHQRSSKVWPEGVISKGEPPLRMRPNGTGKARSEIISREQASRQLTFALLVSGASAVFSSWMTFYTML
jgi:hypothetical protein